MFEDLEAALASRNAELEQSKCQIKTLEEALKTKDEEFAQFRADFNTEKAKLLAEIEKLKAGQQA